jgi:ribosomal protein L11 methyltransferase
VSTTAEAGDAVQELLGAIYGTAAAAYTNALTGATRVSVYGANGTIRDARKRAELRTGLRGLRADGLRAGSGRVHLRRLARENWADSWKRHFKPIEIGRLLLIKPGWIERRARPGQAVVTLDPGLSFGTGRHPTTAFCLKALARWRKSGQRPTLWDVGTGSGILAIAAAKLGYGPVTAIDFDGEAIRAARANAARNRVSVRFARRDVLRLPRSSGTQYSVICANLQSDLLLAARRRLVERLQPGGLLVLAGILRTEFDGVAREYERAGLMLVKRGVGGEWRSGAFVRPAHRLPRRLVAPKPGRWELQREGGSSFSTPLNYSRLIQKH